MDSGRVTGEIFVEGHFVERVDGLVRVAQQKRVDVVVRNVSRRVESVDEIIRHVLHEHRLVLCT